MKRNLKLMLTLFPALLLKAGVILAANPIYPPQTIECTFSQSGAATCTGYDLRYLTPTSITGKHENGTYTFVHGACSTDTKDPLAPISPVQYTYQSSSGASSVILDTTYSGIIADIDNGAWVYTKGTIAPYYWCEASANACPYTNTPYLKKKH